MLPGSVIVKHLNRVQSALSLGIAEHVQGDTLADVRAGANAVDGLLHLPIPPVASLDGVGCRRKQRIVQEGQGLFQRGREQLLERLAEPLEAADSLTEPGQFCQGRVGSAATVEQAVNLVHDLPQGSNFRLAPRDPLERLAFSRRQVVLDEQVAVVEEIGDLGLDAFLAGCQFAVCRRWPAPADLGQRGLQLPTNLGHRLQDGLVEFGDHVELADLVRDRTKDLSDGFGIQRRPIRGDAFEAQVAGLQGLMEPREELRDVFFGWIMVQNLVDQTREPMVVHDRQNAVRAVVEFVGRNVAREVGQDAIEVVFRDAVSGSFPPPLPPSSGQWRMGRIRGDLATSARMRIDRASHPRPPAAPPKRRPGGCSDCWDLPGPTGRR